MIAEHDRVVLATDLPDDGLTEGDVGTVVHVYHGGSAFDIEFVSLDGETSVVATTTVGQVRPVRRNEIAHARALAVA